MTTRTETQELISKSYGDLEDGFMSLIEAGAEAMSYLMAWPFGETGRRRRAASKRFHEVGRQMGELHSHIEWLVETTSADGTS